MAAVDNVYRTFTCNGIECTKTVTFEQTQDQLGLKQAVDANPWMKTIRLVQSVFNGRNFLYCSDECELSAVAAGSHNPEEPKKIIAMPAGANAIAAAAAAAKAAEEGTKALKSGADIGLHQS